jgi:hypothetical protein
MPLKWEVKIERFPPKALQYNPLEKMPHSLEASGHSTIEDIALRSLNE